MTHELIASNFSAHDARIKSVETLAGNVERKLDTLLMWVIGTQAAALLALVGVVVQLVKK